ncbi:MAG: hypothetical protein A2V59_10860 [Armatimonadetes bacterium RBG_19FT_COMBO_69_19]|jgi:hypothetical protein|nr:MAG: hypothetical protein A2V59_10860 [Armatimonadetes bacterium RBG_19FT_COMBO_69_19]
MGRTTQTMTQLVAQEEAYWAPFRRALRKEDQLVFDRLFAAARHHTAPAHYASHSTPFDSILLAMVLEAMKAVEALGRRLDALTNGKADPAEIPRLGDGTESERTGSQP